MNLRALFLFTGLATLPLCGESRATAFTAAQAEAGRAAYLQTCGKCHTAALTGRKGEAGELPRLDELPPAYKKMIESFKGRVPPLVGDAFLHKWNTTQDFALRLKEAVSGFPPGDAPDTYLHLTAYVLQMNGAKAGNQPLTSTTAVPLASLVENVRK